MELAEAADVRLSIEKRHGLFHAFFYCLAYYKKNHPWSPATMAKAASQGCKWGLILCVQGNSGEFRDISFEFYNNSGGIQINSLEFRVNS